MADLTGSLQQGEQPFPEATAACLAEGLHDSPVSNGTLHAVVSDVGHEPSVADQHALMETYDECVPENPAFTPHVVDGVVFDDLRDAAMLLESYAAEQSTSTEPLSVAVLKEQGFKPSSGTVVELAGTPAEGFCLRGSNLDSSATYGHFFWYDSALGLSEVATLEPLYGQDACERASTWSVLAGVELLSRR